MKIAIGADHRGFDLKQKLITSGPDVEWVDCGSSSNERSDFPEFSKVVAEKVQSKNVDRGILLCGSGVGMSIVANRFSGVFAALVWNVDVAKSSREHNDSNVLILPADYLSNDDAIKIVSVWLETEFLGGRYQERIDQIK
jgi:ribose 5-phosphate isomerase B